MKRVLGIVLGVLVAAIVLPLPWFAVFPGDPPPELPAAGQCVELQDRTASI